MIKPLLAFAFAGVAALAASPLIASAQESPAPAATPAAAAAPATGAPTAMDRAYDGAMHVQVAPYLWLPTIKTNYSFNVPTFSRGGGGGPVVGTAQIGPSDYLSKINSGALFDINVRKGDWEVIGDYLYLNVTSNATVHSTISGPLGHVAIPVALSTSIRTATSIWELAAGVSVAHGHNADLNVITGWRQFPINISAGWNAVIGQKGLLHPSGTDTFKVLAGDVIFGLQGKAFLGDGRFYIPYYADLGVGDNNQSWQGYTGAGYAFKHGQSLVLGYRALDYYAFPTTAKLQKFDMGGPLLGYSLSL